MYIGICMYLVSFAHSIPTDSIIVQVLFIALSTRCIVDNTFFSRTHSEHVVTVVISAKRGAGGIAKFANAKGVLTCMFVRVIHALWVPPSSGG